MNIGVVMKLKSLFKKNIFTHIPSSNKNIYSICKMYVDRFNGDNDDNILTNGEFHLMRQVLPIANTVFDIGANIGHWSKLALEINPNMKLHCLN